MDAGDWRETCSPGATMELAGQQNVISDEEWDANLTAVSFRKVGQRAPPSLPPFAFRLLLRFAQPSALLRQRRVT